MSPRSHVTTNTELVINTFVHGYGKKVLSSTKACEYVLRLITKKVTLGRGTTHGNPEPQIYSP